MHSLAQALHWLVEGSHWHGTEGIPARTFEHVQISVTSVAIACAVAIPVGLYIGHTRRLQFLVTSIANLGRAVPSFGILVIAYVVVLKIAAGLAFGFTPTVVAL